MAASYENYDQGYGFAASSFSQVGSTWMNSALRCYRIGCSFVTSSITYPVGSAIFATAPHIPSSDIRWDPNSVFRQAYLFRLDSTTPISNRYTYDKTLCLEEIGTIQGGPHMDTIYGTEFDWIMYSDADTFLFRKDIQDKSATNVMLRCYCDVNEVLPSLSSGIWLSGINIYPWISSTVPSPKLTVEEENIDTMPLFGSIMF
jgi:hypothetical protein